MITSEDIRLLPANHGYQFDDSEDTRRRFKKYINAMHYLVNLCGCELSEDALEVLITQEEVAEAGGLDSDYRFFVENFVYSASVRFSIL